MDKKKWIEENGYRYIKEFGIIHSIKYCYYILTHKYLERSSFIYNYVSKRYRNHLKFDCIKEETVDCFNIWIFWWQGIDNMPPIVKFCYDMVLKYSGEYKVILLTKENYSNYVNIPSYIMEKFIDKKMTITHFSDILRFTLLEAHGGLWLDATVLVTDYLTNYRKILEKDFFTIKRSIDINMNHISKDRWTGFIMGTNKKHNRFFQLGKHLFFKYWEEHSVLIDYFLIDYFIELMNKEDKIIHNMLNNVSVSNEYLYYIERHVNEIFSEAVYKKVISSTFLHKMSYKIKYHEGSNTLWNRLKAIHSKICVN